VPYKNNDNRQFVNYVSSQKLMPKFGWKKQPKAKLGVNPTTVDVWLFDVRQKLLCVCHRVQFANALTCAAEERAEAMPEMKFPIAHRLIYTRCPSLSKVKRFKA